MTGQGNKGKGGSRNCPFAFSFTLPTAARGRRNARRGELGVRGGGHLELPASL